MSEIENSGKKSKKYPEMDSPIRKGMIDWLRLYCDFPDRNWGHMTLARELIKHVEPNMADDSTYIDMKADLYFETLKKLLSDGYSKGGINLSRQKTLRNLVYDFTFDKDEEFVGYLIFVKRLEEFYGYLKLLGTLRYDSFGQINILGCGSIPKGLFYSEA